MEKEIRFVLIGAGAIAQTYARAFEQCRKARLVAVADIRTQAALALADSLGCPSFGSCQALAEQVEFDAAVVCTPPNTHSEICSYFLECKKHVLCEKPLTIDLARALDLLETANRAGMKLTMASKFRYVEDVIQAKHIIDSGILGEIILFENSFTSRVDMASRWNSNPKIAGGGVLIDNGSHSIDLMRYFMGPIAEVQAIEGKRVQRLAVEDTVRVFARSVSGIVGNIDLSWSLNKELDSYLNIYGTQGTVSVGWKVSRYRQSSSRDWVVFGKGYDKIQAFRSQIENFAGSILGHEQLLITARDAIASVEVIEAAYRSLRQEHWVPVNNGIPADDSGLSHGHLAVVQEVQP